MELRSQPLAEAIEIPLEALPEPGELLLRGVLWRLRGGSFDAFCLLCPHEICEVERVTDTVALRREDAALPEPPLLVCPCHFSVFDPERGGEQVVGPATRGLYRFGFEISGARARIDRVEASLVDRFAATPAAPGEPR